MLFILAQNFHTNMLINQIKNNYNCLSLLFIVFIYFIFIVYVCVSVSPKDLVEWVQKTVLRFTL